MKIQAINKGVVLKAQSSFEFLIMSGITLLLFTMIVGLYMISATTLDNIKQHVRAKEICSRISTVLNSFSVLGQNASYTFNLPKYIMHKNYTIWVFGDRRKVAVNYGDKGVICNLQFENIQKSGNVVFEMDKNATIIYKGGIVLVQ